MRMKRTFDLILAIFLIAILLIPLLLIAVLVIASSRGPVIYWSERIGKNNKIFKMPKFRSMVTNTPTVASHLLKDPDSYLSSIGGFLRLSSLDELPQLFSVLKGDMSFVGPRPALFNQYDLIRLRKKYGIDSLVPGITGWAQISGRDKLSINEKVMLDKEYMNKRTIFLDIKILCFTIPTLIQKNNISH